MMRRRRYSTAVIAVVTGLVACAAMATKSVPKDGELALPADYKSWSALTGEPTKFEMPKLPKQDG